MAAHDTFEWFAATMMKHPTPEQLLALKTAREHLQTLRSEDERQRYVDGVIEGFRNRRHPAG